jgi:hypothetical protein
MGSLSSTPITVAFCDSFDSCSRAAKSSSSASPRERKGRVAADVELDVVETDPSSTLEAWYKVDIVAPMWMISTDFPLLVAVPWECLYDGHQCGGKDWISLWRYMSKWYRTTLSDEIVVHEHHTL